MKAGGSSAAACFASRLSNWLIFNPYQLRAEGREWLPGSGNLPLSTVSIHRSGKPGTGPSGEPGGNADGAIGGSCKPGGFLPGGRNFSAAKSEDFPGIVCAGEVHLPQPEEGTSNDIPQQGTIHFIPGAKATQVAAIPSPLDIPGIVLPGRTLEIRIFLLDLGEESGQAPPLIQGDGFEQVKKKPTPSQRLVLPFPLKQQSRQLAQFIEIFTLLP